MWIMALLTAIFLFVYPFVVYPAILYMMTRWRLQNSEEEQMVATELPAVALVICALNEQNCIREKIENCLALQYPAGRLQIVLISDGSTDQTASIAKQYEPSIQVIEQKTRRGKVMNLNDVLPSRAEDILVLSDANVIYRSDALLRLVSRFADPSVGCVSGRVILTGTTIALEGPTKDYYSLEWFLQEKSSSVYSMTGADGAMYALRRELFRPCPNDTLVEDFIVPMGVIGQGKRVVFEPNAVGWEKGVASIREEFRRKVRIAAGAAQGLIRGNAWPRNAPPRFWFIFLSHKLLRWLSPVVGLAILLLCIFSAEQTSARVVMGGFAVLGGLALFRLGTGWTHPVLSAPFYFLFGQLALGIGLLKGITGTQTVFWAKANR